MLLVLDQLIGIVHCNPASRAPGAPNNRRYERRASSYLIFPASGTASDAWPKNNVKDWRPTQLALELPSSIQLASLLHVLSQGK